MRPYDVKTLQDFLAMESDNHPRDPASWSILNHDNGVSLHAPAHVNRGFIINIPRDQFNAIVDWYMKDQSAPPANARVQAPEEFEEKLSDFLEALDEWGCDDNAERAREILEFQRTGYDLDAYLVEHPDRPKSELN